MKQLPPLCCPIPTLHPDFICWYNSCENLPDWTIDPLITASINNVTFQEKAGSLDLDFPNTPKVNVTLTPVSNCDQYFGFWVRFVGAVPSSFYLRLKGTGDWYCIFWSITGGGNWNLNVEHSGGSSGTDSTVLIVADTWYWMEIWIQDGVRFLFRINGTERKDLYTGGTIGALSLLQIHNTDLMGGGHILIDYLRLADRFEYPPT